MREAVGGTFLFKIMIVFIFFFTSFLAIAINYSQAFRIKNQIINAIENYEGYNNDSMNVMASVVNNSGYYRNITCSTKYGYNAKTKESGGTVIKGVCIKETEENFTDGKTKKYYKITTFVSFNFPIIGNVFTIPVIGETKAIQNQ